MYKIESAHRTIVPELLALVGRTNTVVHGLKDLTLDERLRAENMLFGGGGHQVLATVGNRTSTAADAKRRWKRGDAAEPKTAAPKAPAAKRARRQATMKSAVLEEEPDGEECD